MKSIPAQQPPTQQPPTPLNCLQCRHARLLPQTDFTRRGTAIYCAASLGAGQEVGPRIVNFGGCPRAQAMPRKGNVVKWSAVAEQFLCDLFVRAGLAKRARLAALLGRSVTALQVRASRLKIAHPRTPGMLKSGMDHARQSDTRIWTEGQKQFALEKLARGEWPAHGGSKSREIRAKQRVAREEVLVGLAARGRAKNWKAVLAFALRNSPAALRKKAGAK